MAICKHDRGVELRTTEKGRPKQRQLRVGVEPATSGFKSGALTTRSRCILLPVRSVIRKTEPADEKEEKGIVQRLNNVR